MQTGINIILGDDGQSINPETGTIFEDKDDGGVVVTLDAYRKPNKTDFYRNLADEVSSLGTIANDLHQAIEADYRSSSGHRENIKRGMDFLGLEIKPPRSTSGDTSAAVEGLSVVTNPLLLEAVLKSWANAVAELLPAEGPAKVVAEGEASVQTSELADALERDMNFWLTTTAHEYYPDTSHMLLWGTIFGGCGIKKVYSCPMRRRPTSESVPIQDFIVSNTKKDLQSCERITHQTEMRPAVLKRMKMLGVYRNVLLQPPTENVNAVDQGVADIQGTSTKIEREEDKPHTIWEIQCELDLPEFGPKEYADEGIPLPFLVTMDRDSREILSIRRDWKEDDKQCMRKRMYVRFPYVPGPGFYCTGLLNILGNSSAAMTAAWRMALDAGFFASFPSALVMKLGGRQNTSDIRLAPGTLQPVETNGMPISDAIAPLPYRDATPGLLNLMQQITEQAKQAGSVADLPQGEGLQDVAVGTMLAQIEQSTKVVAATFKAMHRAQQEEIDLLIELFREDPESFWRDNTLQPGYWDKQKFEQALDDYDLKPASDPNVPSHMHRVAKAVALVQLTANPMLAPHLDSGELVRRVLYAIKEDPQNLFIANPPPPQMPPGPTQDPLVGQARMLSAQAQVAKAQDSAKKNAADAQLAQQKLAVEKQIADAQLARELVIHRADTAKEMAAEQRANQNQAMDRIHEANQQTSEQAHETRLAALEHQRDMQQHQNEMNLQAQQHQSEMGLEAHKHEGGMVLEREKHQNQMGLAAAQHRQDVVQSDREHAMSRAEHGLAVHEALNKPKKEQE